MNGYDPRDALRDALRSRRCRQRSLAGGYIVSFFIIAVGVTMLLDTLGILPSRSIWDYFPLLFAALGVVKIFQSDGRPAGLLFGGILTVGGTLWFLDNLGFLPFDRRIIPPLIIISVGVLFLLRAVERQSRAQPDPAPHDAESQVSQFTIFGGVKRFVDSPDFRRAEAFSLFGGVELDLRGAKMASGRAEIEANTLFGGIEIRVPQGWAVEVRGIALFGGFEDKTIHPIREVEIAPKLIVNGYAMFGGVTVSNA
jgi:predicted membrane protein